MPHFSKHSSSSLEYVLDLFLISPSHASCLLTCPENSFSTKAIREPENYFLFLKVGFSSCISLKDPSFPVQWRLPWWPQRDLKRGRETAEILTLVWLQKCDSSSKMEPNVQCSFSVWSSHWRQTSIPLKHKGLNFRRNEVG